MKYLFVFIVILSGTVMSTDIVPRQHWVTVLQDLVDMNRQRVDTMLKLYHMQEKTIPKYSYLRTAGKKLLGDYPNDDKENNKKSLIIYITDRNLLRKHRLTRGGKRIGLSIEVPPIPKNLNITAKNTPEKKPVNNEKHVEDTIEEPDLTVGLNLTISQQRMLRKRWYSSCEKKASKLCQRACKDAFKTVCKIFKCKSKMKSKMNKECKKSCKSKFRLGKSGKGSDSGSGSGECGGRSDRSD